MSHPLAAPPTLSHERTHARTHADGRTTDADGGLSGWEKAFQCFAYYRAAAAAAAAAPTDFFPYSRVSSQRQSTSDWIPGRRPRNEPRSGGVGNLPRSPRPGIPRERFFGEPVFPGVQRLDRGHWVPQRLPRAGRRHHARAPRRCLGGQSRPGHLFWRRPTSRH